MAYQALNLGAAPNDRSGDNLRAGGGKINANFTELYAELDNEVAVREVSQVDPNRWRDQSFTNLVAATGAARSDGWTYTKSSAAVLAAVVANGQPGFSIDTADTIEQSIAASQSLAALGLVPGDTIKMSFVTSARNGVSNSATRHLIRQYDASGVEISAARVTTLIPTLPGTISASALVHASAVKIDFYWSVGGSGDPNYQVTKVLLHTGATEGYRPPLSPAIDAGVDDRFPRKFATTNRRALGRMSEASAPNVWPDPFYERIVGAVATPGTRFKDRILVSRSSTAPILTTATVDGAPAFRIEASGASETSVVIRGSIEDFGLDRAKPISISMMMRDRVGPQQLASRIRVYQYPNTAGTSPLSTYERAIPGDSGVDQAIEIPTFTADPATVEIGLYISMATAGSGATFSDVTFCNGSVAYSKAPAVQTDRHAEVYLATTGADADSGSFARPVATLAGARIKAPNGKLVILASGGVYTGGAGINLKGLRSLKILAQPHDQPIFKFGTAIATGAWSAAPGYTDVWRVAIPASLTDAKYLWEDGRAFSPLGSYDHPLYRGRTHRSPLASPYYLVADLASLVAGAWTSDATYVYVKTIDGGAPSRTFYLPDTLAGIIYPDGANATNDRGLLREVEMLGITDMYGYTGPRPRYAMKAHLTNCRSIGGRTLGFVGDGVSDFLLDHPEAIGAGGDNINIHQATSLGAPDRGFLFRIINALSVGSWDDGFSPHEACQGDVVGGLYEMNGGDGIVYSYGASGRIASATARGNGAAWGIAGVGTGVSAGKGAGFGYTGTLAGSEGGYTGLCELVDCLAEDNFYHAKCDSGATNKMVVTGLVIGSLKDPVGAGYAAFKVKDGSTIIRRDTRKLASFVGTVDAVDVGSTLTVDDSVAV